MHQLALRLIAKAKESSDPLDEPVRALDWWYPEDEHGEPDMEAVLAEINGWSTLEMWERPQRRDEGVDRGTKPPPPLGDGIVFGLDREGNPHHGPQVDGLETEGRRFDRKRRLDLLRRSWAGQSEQGELPQREKLSRPRLGLRLAGRSPHYI